MNMTNTDLEKAIYRWFDMKYKMYNKLERLGFIYLYYEGYEFADFRIDTKSKYIYYKLDFWEEFSDIFPIERDEFKQFMTIWLEDVLNLKGLIPGRYGLRNCGVLEIPQ